MGSLAHDDEQVARLVRQEKRRQRNTLSLIAAENIVSKAVMEAQGSVFTNRSVEGYPGKRYFPGMEFVDGIEALAIERAKKLFGAEHANVQPHCGTLANVAAYQAVLTPGDTILAMELTAGGHLSHGHAGNIVSQIYRFISYGVNRETELIDYEEVRRLALEHRPRMIIGGATSYPRLFDWQKLRSIADEVNAFLLADIAHLSGLVAAGVIPSPVPYADLVTSSCHKTIEGPRGGFILCKSELSSKVDKAVFPGHQSGALENLIAGKAVCFKLAMEPEFRTRQNQIIKNARALAEDLKTKGLRPVTNGTDIHLLLVDLRSKGIKGNEAENSLNEIGIMVNRNVVPGDTEPSNIASGIRIGTPPITKRGMEEKEMHIIAEIIGDLLDHLGNERVRLSLKRKVQFLCRQFPASELR